MKHGGVALEVFLPAHWLGVMMTPGGHGPLDVPCTGDSVKFIIPCGSDTAVEDVMNHLQYFSTAANTNQQNLVPYINSVWRSRCTVKSKRVVKLTHICSCQCLWGATVTKRNEKKKKIVSMSANKGREKSLKRV